MSKPARGERFRLELLAEPIEGWPAAIRLRLALKRLLRSFRLRCYRVEELPAAVTPPASGDQDKPQGG